MVPLGACLVPTALDTWAVKGHVGSLDVGPIDQNGAKSERSREIFPLGQECLLALLRAYYSRIAERYLSFEEECPSETEARRAPHER